MGYRTIRYETLKHFSEDLFALFGFNKKESSIITDVLLTADLYGIESHGIQRLARYYNDILKGVIRPKNKPKVVYETPISAVLDGCDGMGQLIGRQCMEMVISKAKQSGIGMAVVRNSNHYGIAGYYAKLACDQGLIGVSLTNSSAIMVPTFGRKASLGSNPIAICVPADPYPFFFDAATTVVTRGKLEVYNKNDEPLREGWTLDAQGNPSRNAGEVLDNIINKSGGGILPIGGGEEESGGHKGYGFAMICEIFTAILSLGETSNHTYVGLHAGICHGFAAIDPKLFGDPDQIFRHLSAYLEELRNSPKAENAERIYTHGEKEIEATALRMKEGIPVNDNTLLEMLNMCRNFNLSFKDYFGFEM